MPKPFEKWTVLPHGKLTEIDDGLLTVVGDLHMPLGDFPRRMTVVRLQNGKLVIYSAIALHDDEMRELERYGTPAFLVVPSEIHRLDAKTWRDRYPNIVVVAAAGSREKVDEVVTVDATDVDFGDPDVSFITVPGTDRIEAAIVVERPGGSTLIVNDIIWNVDNLPGIGGWVMKKLGFTGEEPKIPPFVAKKRIDDKDAFCTQLRAWAALRDLRRIIVSHGAIIEREPPSVLRGLAARLAA